MAMELPLRHPSAPPDRGPASGHVVGVASLVKALHLAAAVFDHEGRLHACNQAFESAFAPLDSLDLDAFVRRLEPFADIGLPHADGSDDVYCPATGRSYSLAWSELAGDPPLRLMTALDLTDRVEWVRRHRALQDQLLLTSRAMSVGEMATTLAHELNQPLATIINYLSMALPAIEKQRGLPARVTEAVTMARSQAEHAAAVISRVREFVRTRQPHRGAHRMRDIAQHVALLLQLEAHKHRVRLQLELPDTLPPVFVDRVMIEQVLANLVKNAIEAMRDTPPADRQVTVSARLDADDRVQVRVADRGTGLPLNSAEQLFAPFLTTKSNGMGIGLAICRSIVEFHEGNLYFENNADGGASFIFALPVAENEGRLQ